MAATIYASQQPAFRGGGGPPVYLPETLAWNTARTNPLPTDGSSIRLGLVNTWIQTYMTSGIWAKRDVIWLPAMDDSQAATLNLKSPGNFSLVPVGSPTFTIDRGFQGNGTSSYLTTGWNPAINSVTFTQTDAHGDTYINAIPSDVSQSGSAFGQLTVSNGFLMLPRNSSANMSARANANASNSTALAIQTHLGAKGVGRSGSSSPRDQNGSPLTPVSNGNVAIANAEMYILAFNSNGTVASFYTGRVAQTSFGGNLSTQEIADKYSADLAYLTAIGAN